MRELRPSLDLVHDNGLWLPHNHAIARAARKFNLPRVLTPRGMLEPWAVRYRRLKKTVAWTLYQRRDINSAAVIHATSAGEADNLRRIGLSNPVVVVPNGIDVPPQIRVGTEVSGSSRRALFIGRLHPGKGIPMLLEAWAREQPKNWELIIAGPAEVGHDREIRNAIERLGLDDSVRLIGPVYGARKISLYKSAHLSILPTHSENFGISVAEALAHEVPVLTTTGAPWRLLEDENCGWWVRADVSGLQEGLRVATSTPTSQLRQMGRRGRSVMKARFAWNQVAKDVRDHLYRPLMN
jgi:glycosyltransferase involved in cell wall biosynthesis